LRSFFHITKIAMMLIVIDSCLGDPAGPGALVVGVDGASVDTVWNGAPGEVLPGTIRLSVRDLSDRPIPAAQLTWEVVGRDGQLLSAASQSDAAGNASAVWQLGTDAAEEQRLHVVVQTSNHQRDFEIRARAVPHIVAQVRAVIDTPAVVRLGDMLAVAVNAIDPYGNVFPAPDVEFTVTDTSRARVFGSGFITGPRRGSTVVRISSHGAETVVPVRVVQYVAAIQPATTGIELSSLGAAVPLAYEVRDDRGRVVADTSAALVSLDTAVARVVDGRVQAVATGATAVQAAIGPVQASVAVAVNQRIAALRLLRDTIRFDALRDTTTVYPIARDSLGSTIPNPNLVLRTTNGTVAAVAGVTLRALAPGVTTATIEDPVTGIATSVPVIVEQRVAAILVDRDMLLFESLNAVQQVQGTPLDRLGSPVADAGLAYSVDDSAVVDVDATGQVRAVGNGSAAVVIASGQETVRVVVNVTQRPVRVVFPADTIRFTAFNDTVVLQGTAVDSLGSPVAGEVSDLSVVDGAVIQSAGSTTIRALGNGTTTAVLTVAGFTGQVAVVVDQIATSLDVHVEFPSEVITLPAGSPFPLSCVAVDRNGYAIARQTVLVGSVKGTVSGAPCRDAIVQHSGYDTLTFAMGALQARVPVIVSTGDSVGVLATAQPLSTNDRIRFLGEDLGNPLILALRPLVSDILSAYGNPTTNLDRARALRDWVSRTAVHPYQALHPDGSTSNLNVLPPGKSWADVNPVSMGRVNDDPHYWGAEGLNGYGMLDRLLGTLDRATGRRADDGMMVHVAGARYQIRDIASYRYVLCSYQDVMLNALWAAAGLHGMLISTVGHDPAAVFIPELGRWVYEDPEYNEEYLLDGVGDPLSPVDLLRFSSNGDAGRLRAVKGMVPTFDSEIYAAHDTYMNEGHPDGFVIMGSQLNNAVVETVVVGTGDWPVRYVQIDVPRLAAESPFNDSIRYARVSATEAFPTLGPTVEQVAVDDSVHVVRLSSTFPKHQRFERRLDGQNWESVGDVDVLPVGSCRVQYRSIDAIGSISASATLDVWAPRTEEFVQSALSGSVRAKASYCVSP
jgi:hypothetical protein